MCNCKNMEKVSSTKRVRRVIKDVGLSVEDEAKIFTALTLFVREDQPIYMIKHTCVRGIPWPGVKKHPTSQKSQK